MFGSDKMISIQSKWLSESKNVEIVNTNFPGWPPNYSTPYSFYHLLNQALVPEMVSHFPQAHAKSPSFVQSAVGREHSDKITWVLRVLVCG